MRWTIEPRRADCIIECCIVEPGQWPPLDGWQEVEDEEVLCRMGSDFMMTFVWWKKWNRFRKLQGSSTREGAKSFGLYSYHSNRIHIQRYLVLAKPPVLSSGLNRYTYIVAWPNRIDHKMWDYIYVKATLLSNLYMFFSWAPSKEYLPVECVGQIYQF